MNDVTLMRRALGLAARGAGLTSPNPMVGAVIVKDSQVVGEGFHAAAGQPHAEIEALAVAGARARGGTVYVTLEPCAHQGRTAPCALALVAAGLARVVVAAVDPNPLVNGRGIEALRRAGLSVQLGVLAEEAEVVNRAFFTRMRRGRPHVTLKAAVTLDGKLADRHGHSRWITGDAARAEAHRLRSLADAIVIGAETALHDDPALTVRLDRPWPREPYRVVVDSRARLPPTARVIHAATPSRAVVAVARGATEERVRSLRGAGATVVECPGHGGRVDLEWLLRWLAEREVTALLLEGGAELNAGFLDRELVDRAVLFMAPMVLGGRAAPSAVGGVGRVLADAVRLREVEVRWAGDDIVVEGEVSRE